MVKSDLLRVQDVRDAYRLIGECRDLGSDPTLWHARMLNGLCQLVGAPIGSGGEARWLRPHNPIQQLTAFDSRTDRRFREGLMVYRRARAFLTDPIFGAFQRMPGQLITLTRRALVSDAVWYRSHSYEYRRLTGGDHQLTSVYQVSEDGGSSVIALHRAVRERDFSPREVQLLNFFHGELGPLIRRALVSATEPSPEKLSPRLRQTLACLVEGDSEKQMAARLSLSHDTTHQYVTALYRHFRVASRAQLMAHVIKRLARREWKEVRLAAESGSDDEG